MIISKKSFQIYQIEFKMVRAVQIKRNNSRFCSVNTHNAYTQLQSCEQLQLYMNKGKCFKLCVLDSTIYIFRVQILK